MKIENVNQVFLVCVVAFMLLVVLYISYKEKKRKQTLKSHREEIKEEGAIVTGSNEDPPHLPVGGNYRVKINLKNGEVLYTEIFEHTVEDFLNEKIVDTSLMQCHRYMNRDRFKIGNEVWFASEVSKMEAVEVK